MATVTFQTIVCDKPHGAISLHFSPVIEPNPFFGPRLGSKMTPNVAESLGNVTRTFSNSATVTLSVQTKNGSFTEDKSIFSTGSLSLPFTVNGANFIVTCNVT
ncbi:MAG: hypothetical protein KME01_13055 [Chroococcus sp. CMT-3BRIN-NPC107]|jgi:hypothetical protein|nr:hypothetical protein [Chroococcus sp. CMT-3BRIN-NPC107]